MVIEAEQQKYQNRFLKEILLNKKINSLTDIQKKAQPFLFTKDNLVIVAPSGAGKTLIAEIIAIKDLIFSKNPTKLNNINLTSEQNDGKTIFLVPLRALAEEKANQIAREYRQFKLKIHLSMSEIDFDENEISKSHIIISTYERFKSILGRMPNLIELIKNVVVDEFHLIGSKNRGPILETILTTLSNRVRLILLSATIENPDDIAKWLNAKLIISKQREIPLSYKIDVSIFPEKIVEKVIKTAISSNGQVLIFCGTRNKAEEYAEFYSEFIKKACIRNNSLEIDKIKAFIESVNLPKDTIGNKQLFNLVQYGTAFHNAGLSRMSRKIIEEMFRENLIKVLFCTETLGAGVNLPVRDVIIYDTKRWNNEWLSRNVFHQLAGRAGRLGLDSYGNCTIIANDTREKRAIINRYWFSEKNNFNNESSIDALEQRFDEINTMILNIDELEKMILNLIYTNTPTKDELLELLKKTFLDYCIKRIVSNNFDNIDDEQLNNIQQNYFKILIDDIESYDFDVIEVLDHFYSTRNLSLNQILSGEKTQSIFISDNGQQFIITKTEQKLTCSCSTNQLFCAHRLFVLKQINIDNALEIIKRNFSILTKLAINGYIIETAKNHLQTTAKGGICAEMGISVETFEKIKDWLLYDLFSKKPTLGQIIFECLKFIPQVETDSFMIDNTMYHKAIYDHIILGKDLVDVINKYLLYEGDLSRVESSLKSFLAGLLPLSEFLGLTSLHKKFANLDLLLSDVFWNSF
ncbi:MAG: DEAD/DEAH box helicase [Asgard group archaeon]|nr:DEAD/DEAH box helicase [Asgard group archaeon]